MKPVEFIVECLMRESPPSDAARRWDEHIRWTLIHELRDLVSVTARLDQVKRILFYGVSKPLKEEVRIELPPMLDERTARLLHACIGIATEAGELVNASIWRKDDPESAIEELGDLFWYIAIACAELELPFEKIWEANVAKLKARYPNGFTSNHAANRNRERELDALRQGGLDDEPNPAV